MLGTWQVGIFHSQDPNSKKEIGYQAQPPGQPSRGIGSSQPGPSPPAPPPQPGYQGPSLEELGPPPSNRGGGAEAMVVVFGPFPGGVRSLIVRWGPLKPPRKSGAAQDSMFSGADNVSEGASGRNGAVS